MVKKSKSEKGFSLIELVIVVSVLSVLSAIAIPTFNCFQRKSKATAALAALKQIQTECNIKKTNKGESGTFMTSSLNSYLIQSNGSSNNSCEGATEFGLISAIPDNTNILPTFILSTNANQISYDFKGETGTDLSNCMSMICLTGGNGSTSAIQEKLEKNTFVQKDTFKKRNDSCYVLVDGPSWSDAQANALKIGGNLVTISDESENDWIINQYQDIGMNMDVSSGVRHIFIGLKRGDGTGQQSTNASGYSDGWVSGENSTWRPPYWGQLGEQKNADGVVIGNNQLEGHDSDGAYSALNVLQAHTGDTAMNWNDFPEWQHTGKGMAEISPCNN